MAAEKTEIIFGFHSVYEALRSGKRIFYKLILQQKRSQNRIEKIHRLASEKNIKIETADPKFLDKMCDFENHQGMAAEVSHYPLKNASDLVPLVQSRSAPSFILIAESIEDPHNLGALIRTGLCAGVDFFLIPKNRSVQPSASVSRSSAGAMEHADLYAMTNTASVLRELKKAGIWVSGLDAEGTTSLFDSDLTGNIAMVIGGEHKGIRPGVRKECDFLLSIPNKSRINSLNASVAGGIAMYEASRQRS